MTANNSDQQDSTQARVDIPGGAAAFQWPEMVRRDQRLKARSNSASFAANAKSALDEPLT